ncbi:PAAR domain-containing protein [Luteimonas lutimaris]|uniref:PAAR domain-containing protein n=1 Tax=Luteimonas lutimaris TaxID=698645 RepID=A0ABP7MIG1_9GAMM
MAKNWIVVGDPTSSGGSVLTGSSFTGIDGLPVARVTDQATCPSHKGAFPIVDGDATIIIDGQPVALHGSSLACGCKVLSAKQMRAFVEPGGGGSGGSGIAASAIASVSGLMAGAAAGKPEAEENNEYDEALRFCGESGTPLAGVRYTVHLASGETRNGVTDSDGKTERICTSACEPFLKVVLSPPDGMASCCSLHGSDGGDEVVIELEDVRTNASGLGQSTVEVRAEGHERELTQGELRIARLVFGDSVDYTKIKIHNHGYWMLFGFQRDRTAVTPNGQMYFPKPIHVDDFSAAADHRALFMHEMVHVWQYQLGYSVRWHGLFVSSKGAEAYEYRLSPGSSLSDYNMEQQGDIISDYYMTVISGEPEFARGSGASSLQFKEVLRLFLDDPSSRANLPKH